MVWCCKCLLGSYALACSYRLFLKFRFKPCAVQVQDFSSKGDCNMNSAMEPLLVLDR